MIWYVIIKIKVLCPSSGSHRKLEQNNDLCPVQDSLVPWLCSRSQPGIEGQYKGPLEAFVTYCSISCFQTSFNLAGIQQRREISIEFHYEQNQIMPLGIIGPFFRLASILQITRAGIRSRLSSIMEKISLFS